MGDRYCNYSCAIDNGGCAQGEQCIEVPNLNCNPGQCCSPVSINCSGKYFIIICDYYIQSMYVRIFVNNAHSYMYVAMYMHY